MQIKSFSSLANTAFDTARNNLKSMADAAAQSGASPERASDPQPVAVPAQADAVEAPKPAKGQRQGVSLDAYA